MPLQPWRKSGEKVYFLSLYTLAYPRVSRFRSQQHPTPISQNIRLFPAPNKLGSEEAWHPSPPRETFAQTSSCQRRAQWETRCTTAGEEAIEGSARSNSRLNGPGPGELRKLDRSDAATRHSRPTLSMDAIWSSIAAPLERFSVQVQVQTGPQEPE